MCEGRTIIDDRPNSHSAPQPLPKRQFASDNYAGICPEAWQAMAAANVGHALSYGDDEWTRRACDLLREMFETDCEVFFTFTGTAANSLAVATLCKPYQSVICHEFAHLETDECGAPEFSSNGSKVLLAPDQAGLPAAAGKIDIAGVEHLLRRRSDIHYPRPHVLSLTQATELGTVYSVDEIQAVGRRARDLGLRVHMDGARLANALATLHVAANKITWRAGVDVLCLGGSKNAMGIGEAVVFFDRDLAAEFDYRCKQAGQLCSKMRFIAAQWVGVLESGAWLANAQRANRAAADLAARLRQIPGVKLLFPPQANSVFVELPAAAVDALHRRGWHFYTFIGCGGARLMCSWDTTEADITAFAADLRAVLDSA
ncbi:MAG: low specificity L-threonine aldolase [Planctomycetes bacterium]|nr:low specificity L-threonine aldolase [Planctomycetota bacterium]